MMVAFKGLGFALLVLVYFAGASFFAIGIHHPEKLRQARLRWCQRCSIWCLKLLGMQVDYADAEANTSEGKAHLFVSNHLSYLDILVVAARFPSVFVTSMEIRDTPFLGHIAKLAGCEFVERRNRSTVERDIRVLAEIMRQGTSVCLFPEGTSTNGTSVLPFKRSLLTSAVEAEIDVIPLCLNYTQLDGRPVDAGNRDDLCWYGTMDFFPHLMRVLSHQQILVKLVVCNPITFSARITRDEIADTAYERISGAFSPIC